MFWSFSVGRLAGTTVRIHVTFLLFVAWLTLDAYSRSGLSEASRTLIFIVTVFACIVAHEFGHVLVARVFGIATPDMTLYPFGGIARLNSIPQEPLQEFLIAIAGPAVNFVIAGGLLLVAGARLTPEALLQDHADLVSRLASANLVLALFNLLPAFPMDGGRVLRAALSARFGFERATRLAAVVGHWLAILLAVGGIFINPMLIIIAVFILFAATAELQATEVRVFSKDFPVVRAMITEFAVLPAQSTVADAVQLFLHTSQTVIPVIDENGKFLGIIQIGDLIRELHAHPATPRPVADMAVRDIPQLSSRATLDEAFRVLREKALPAVAIVDDNAGLLGLVTPETLTEMLMLHEASPSVFDGLKPAQSRGTMAPARAAVGASDAGAATYVRSTLTREGA